MPDKKKKKSASLGCLFWIAFILLILVLFFFNKANIQKVLESTKALDLLKKTENARKATGPEAPKIPEVTTAPVEETAVAPAKDASAKENAAQGEPKVTEEKPKKTPDAEPQAPKPEPKPKATATQETTKPKAASGSATAKPADKPQATRASKLYFVTIDADGRVLRSEATRDIPQSDAPLSDSLKALFAGTNAKEADKGLRSLIPTGTRLISATVKDGVATINVSEEFQFNQFGIEGYIGQLAQVVFTATAFPTVTSVQFLIEGQRKEYLGAEGVWIGTPLDRAKF
jgi:spore germination protein GerM